MVQKCLFCLMFLVVGRLGVGLLECKNFVSYEKLRENPTNDAYYSANNENVSSVCGR